MLCHGHESARNNSLFIINNIYLLGIYFLSKKDVRVYFFLLSSFKQTKIVSPIFSISEVIYFQNIRFQIRDIYFFQQKIKKFENCKIEGHRTSDYLKFYF